MLKLAADENFNNDVVRGLLRRRPDLDEDILLLAECSLEGEREGKCVICRYVE